MLVTHGTCDHPELPCTVCATATPPPERSTLAANHFPEAPAGGPTKDSLCGPIETVVTCGGPDVPTTVIVPCTACDDTLVSTTAKWP